MRCVDLRDRLVSTAPTGCRLFRGVARRPSRHLHGRHVPRQPAAAPLCFGAQASFARVRDHRSRHRRLRRSCAPDPAATRSPLRHCRRQRPVRNSHARRGRCRLPAPADPVDGRVPPCHRPLRRIVAAGSFLAWIFLWRQHRRRRVRMPVRGLLSAPRLRHADGHLRRRRDQRSGRVAQLSPFDADPLRADPARRFARSQTAAGGAKVRVRCHRPLRVDRARRGSRVDAPSFGHARRDCLHVLDHPRSVSGRFRLRQRLRITSCAPDETPARRARRLPDPAGRGDRVDRLHVGRCTAQLADRSDARQERRLQFSGRHHALYVGRLSRRLPLGRELSVRAGRRRGAQ
jgi:hypothetical protein